MSLYRHIEEVNLRGRRVLVRVDLNVPLKKKGDTLEVADNTRIEGALETIRYILKQDAKCILASHLGRPNGKVDKKYSLEPVGVKLSEKLGDEVFLSEDCIGDSPKAVLQRLRGGQLLLLENLRFHPGEEENSAEFSNRLLELFDVFIGDAFGTLHRAHASTYQVPLLAPEKAIGFLIQKELKYLEPLRNNPKRPFVLAMGGSKISDKMGVIEHFLSKVDSLLIGGAMAYAFLKAQDIEIGKSLCDPEQVFIAQRLLKIATTRKVKILVPIDHVITNHISKPTRIETTKTPSIPPGSMGVDIGPATLALFQKELQGAETIFWNGPMGVFENPAFAKGTFELAKAIGETKAQKLAGGGDVAAAIKQSGCESQFNFISTGGGATLEYLEGKNLPGLTALEI